MTLSTIVRAILTPTLAALVGVVAVDAQTQTYSGVGGRFEQQLNAHQRNVPLVANGDVNIPYDVGTRRIFVRFSPSTSRNVSGFSIEMRFGVGARVVPAWLYTADAQNRPANIVATGQIGIDAGAGYMRDCRASFADKYTVQANTFYFLAFQLPAGENLRFATVSGGPSTAVTYFVTPTGPALQANIRYGVHADGYSPKISLQQPYIGGNYTVSLTQASLNDPAVLWFTQVVPGSPLDLTNFGAPGSFLYLNLSNMLFGAYAPGQPNRSRSWTFLMPYAPNLIGQPLYFQWQVGTNSMPAGWVTSDMAACVIR